MKPVFCIDITEDKKNERINGEALITKSVSDKEKNRLESNHLELEETVDESRLPWILRIVKAICGFGGAYVSFITCSGMWIQDCVGGLGWIAVALVIFASWSPYRALLGSLVFGALSVVQFYKPAFMRGISDPLFSMMPFLVTAIVLVITSIRMRPERMQPKSCGLNYDREDR